MVMISLMGASSELEILTCRAVGQEALARGSFVEDWQKSSIAEQFE
jgi:hypothetical protein